MENRTIENWTEVEREKYNYLYSKGYPHGNPLQIVNNFKIKNTKSCIDLGCGRATLSEYFETYIGVDISDYMISKNIENNTNGKYFNSSLDDLSFLSEEKHDIAICSDVMEHIPEDKVVDVLNSISKLKVDEFYFDIALKESQILDSDGDNLHLTVWEKDKWFEELSKVFKLIEARVSDSSILVLCNIKNNNNSMEMFNDKVLKERIGDLKKSSNLKVLEKVEKYVLQELKKYKVGASYDVLCEEMPYFDTIGYTEYGTNFIMSPLNLKMKEDMIRDAEQDNGTHPILDYASYLKSNIKNKIANKYQGRKDCESEYKNIKALVVLPGSNKLKSHICLNKLKAIKKLYGEDVYFKPHPITTHSMIGELKDLFGEKSIMLREDDMYSVLQKAEKIYTTHISESALYAIVLGKEIEPIDVYNEIRKGSFYAINCGLFENQANGIEWINKVFSSPKSGIINPILDDNWKEKVDLYLKYIMSKRDTYKNWYIDGRVPNKNKKQ